ncbi:uncharacterized protein BDZ83DRAFT_630830 [Colletotrichum acutatum]|uniref:Uncharacterized protein n=1 Tax=Glomerella acutata TaxID=27357 RepID=A0AAD8XD39_GLOAC|nr:uncharacterized protein BDZ83DRAFT_630830 [Colletotrichum acutatum]KAK1720360.1 hypothetical protein BDZ83DRAFT_630830 [Colletotrichum acutatum]
MFTLRQYYCRLLRNWLTHPPVNKAMLQAKLSSVTQVMTGREVSRFVMGLRKRQRRIESERNLPSGCLSRRGITCLTLVMC